MRKNPRCFQSSVFMAAVLWAGWLTPVQDSFAQPAGNPCDPALFKIGRQLRLFEIATGKLPQKISDLYIRGFVKQLEDFQCSQTEPGITQTGDIDDKTHFELLPETGAGEEDPILVTKATAGTSRRALLRNGEIVDWKKEGTMESESTAVADLRSTPVQPRSEAQLQLDQDLLEAARKGDMDLAQKAIQDGADVNVKGENGATSLGWAASKGHAGLAQILIKSGADLNWEAPRGQTPLNVAARKGQVDVIELLLTGGANVNQKVKSTSAPDHYQGATPIFMAVESDNLETIRELIRAGAEVNAANNIGATPVMFSVQRQNLGPLLVLIEAGADLNAKINADAGPGAGTTALMGAAIEGNLKAAQVLALAGADVNTKDAEGSTALDHAMKKGHTEIAQLLREPGQVSMLAKSGLAPEMMQAIEKTDTKVVQSLLKLGLNPNAKDKKGFTALMRAIENGSLNMARLLINEGADVNARDSEYGATPLILAASKGQGKIAELLIQSRADINQTASGNRKGEGAGWTALMAASLAGDPGLASQLLSAGANADAVNNLGETALHIAKKEGKKDVVRLLENIVQQKPQQTIPHIEGLVSFYPFNGNSEDESGNGIHGTVHGAVLTGDRFGIANEAYYLDGKDDYFDLGNLGGMDFEDRISVSLWVKPESFADWKRFFARGHVNGCTHPWVNIYLGTWDSREKNRPRFALALNGRLVQTPRNIGFSLEEHKWYHLVGSYDGANMKLYVNGVLISAVGAQGKIDNNSNKFALGVELDGCRGGPFQGVIDDVRIYKRALSQSEITDIFNPGR